MLKLSWNLSKKRIFPSSFLEFCLSYAICEELCEKLRFEVNYAKSQHRRISEALLLGVMINLSQRFRLNDTKLASKHIHTPKHKLDCFNAHTSHTH